MEDLVFCITNEAEGGSCTLIADLRSAGFVLELVAGVYPLQKCLGPSFSETLRLVILTAKSTCKPLHCMITKSCELLPELRRILSCRIGMLEISLNLPCCVLYGRPHRSWKTCITSLAICQTRTCLPLIGLQPSAQFCWPFPSHADCSPRVFPFINCKQIQIWKSADICHGAAFGFTGGSEMHLHAGDHKQLLQRLCFSCPVGMRGPRLFGRQW